MHRQDWVVINYGQPWVEKLWNSEFQTVRGDSQEGHRVFAGSDNREKSHLKVGVHDPSYILGYFNHRQPT